MEDVFDTLAYETAGKALMKLLPLTPFKLSAIDQARLRSVLVSTLTAYRDHGGDAELTHDFAVAATKHIIERLPLTPPDDVREKMICVCEEMLADFRRRLRRRPWVFEPSAN